MAKWDSGSHLGKGSGGEAYGGLAQDNGGQVLGMGSHVALSKCRAGRPGVMC